MKIRLLIFLLMQISSVGCATHSEVPAGCFAKAHFPVEAYKAWMQSPVEVLTSEKTEDSPLLNLSVRSALQLKMTNDDSRGFVHFQTTAAGDYFIVSDFYPRMNVLDMEDGRTSLTADAWGPVRECDSMKKSLRFKLKGRHKYALEVISRDNNKVNVLILPATAN